MNIRNYEGNIVPHYVLPLVNVSPMFFGATFTDAKVNKSLSEVIVILNSECKEKYWENVHYLTDYPVGNSIFVKYKIPEEFKYDMELIAKGKYSRISKEAKNLIYRLSGLWYNKTVNSVTVTDIRLLALAYSKKCSDYLYSNYGVTVPQGAEMLKLQDPYIIYIA